MQAISKLQSTSVGAIVQQTIQAFAPLLKRSEIEAVPRKTFAYGSSPRHQLDVFYPEPRSDGKKPPVIQFVYGGGFVQGDKSSPAGWSQNVGAFWAKKGYVAVTADYRLLPGVTYPGPPADLRDAMSWVVDNVSDVADVSKYFFIAHSAGGTHFSTMLGHPLLVPDHLLQRIKAAVLMCPLFVYPTEGRLAGPLVGYHGSLEALEANSPQKLLENTPSERAALWPPLRLLVAEHDDETLMTSHPLYVETLKKKGIKIDEGVMKGHNHLSPSMGLFTGEGEEWTEEVDKWFKSF